MSTADKQVVLLGIGHTNAHILHMWRRHPIPGARLTCISSFPAATYSGMLPGSLSGQYGPQHLEIDLKSLASAARAELILEPGCGVDPERRIVGFSDRGSLRFDVLSIGVGSVPNTVGVKVSGSGFLPIKPMQTFLMRLYARVRELKRRGLDRLRVLVVGGGVAGIEISLCVIPYLRSVTMDVPHEITLVEAHERIGRGLSRRALRAVENLLERRKINVETGKKAVRVTDDEAVFDDGRRIDADVVVWATGAAPPPVVETIVLPKDEQGFLATHATLQSTGAENIFAVGDAGTVVKNPAPKAGVYAVRQGPILWRNIRGLLGGRQLTRYVPQRDFLRLLNTGDGKALLDYKGRAIHARWCWFLKDWIDSRFMSRYRVMRG